MAVVVGVSGGSGSGKTTLCRELVARFGEGNVAHLKQDNYYRDLSHLEPEERDRVNFDHPHALEFELLSTHLQQLMAGLAIDVPSYDFATHTRCPQTVRLAPKSIILIEGILIFSQPDVLKLMTHSIFVDTPEQVRLERRIRRDIAERGRTKESVESQFMLTVAPMHDLFVEPSKLHAHIVISGEEPFADFIENLSSSIETKPTKKI